jgi:hypothetical protein
MAISLNPFAKSPTVRIRWLPEIAGELLPRFQKLARDLHLVSRARAEGAENRPNKDDQELDAAQREVGTTVVEGVNLLRQFLRDQLHRAKEQIQTRFPRRIDSQVALIEARAAVQEAKHAHGEQLVNLSLEEHRKRRQIKKFRADNGLSRDASYASHPIIPLAILFAMTAVEMAANSALFAKTNPMGYVGGAFQALIFGVVNVAIGFGAGFLGLRLVGHVKGWFKALGFAIFLLTLSGGVYWNLKVAHYRDLLERNAEANFLNHSSVLPTLDWLSLSTIESWALFLFGLLIFVIATLKGCGGRTGFSDSYWGYSSMDVAHREAEASYRAGKDEYRAAVRAAIEAARDNLRKRVKDDGIRVAEVIEIADAALIRTQEVRDSIGEWIAMGASLLRHYREENEKVRTAPCPDHFRVYPTFEQVADRIPDASDVRALAEAADRQHAENVAALAQAEADLVRLGTEEAERFLAEIDAIEERVGDKLEEEWNIPARDRMHTVAALPQMRRAG